MKTEWLFALVGGGLIGVSVSLMLLWNGRVAGISGIVNGILAFKKSDLDWRVLFVLGLVSGGFLMKLLKPDVFSGQLADTSTVRTVVAGLLVGFGTIMGSGCTSGHGVCGISRLSIRSIIATVTFIAAGVLSVALFKAAGVF